MYVDLARVLDLANGGWPAMEEWRVFHRPLHLPPGEAVLARFSVVELVKCEERRCIDQESRDGEYDHGASQRTVKQTNQKCGQ